MKEVSKDEEFEEILRNFFSSEIWGGYREILKFRLSETKKHSTLTYANLLQLSVSSQKSNLLDLHDFLYIHGTRDRKYSKLAEKLDKSKVQSFETGHAVHLEVDLSPTIREFSLKKEKLFLNTSFVEFRITRHKIELRRPLILRKKTEIYELKERDVIYVTSRCVVDKKTYFLIGEASPLPLFPLNHVILFFWNFLIPGIL